MEDTDTTVGTTVKGISKVTTTHRTIYNDNDDWTNWCKGYNAGFSSYTDNSQQQEQTQGQSSFINVRGNNNVIGLKQSQGQGQDQNQQSSNYGPGEDIGSYSPSGYDSNANPNC